MLKTGIKIYNTLRNVVTKVYHILELKKYETPKGRKEVIENIDAVTLALFKQSHGIATKKSLFKIIAPRCSYKTMKLFASWSKSSKGWFYGLKLHLTTDVNDTIVGLYFTSSNSNDREILKKMNKDLTGVFIADAGYISSQLERDFFIENKRMLLTCSRSNMKKIATFDAIELLKTRMQIEDNFGNLKQFHNLVSTVCRSPRGYFVNYLSSICSYMLV